MSYRMFIKPLTEQTGAKPENHEVMVNTSTGMISIINSEGENVSGLKDITTKISLEKEILYFLDIVNKDLVVAIKDLEPKYNQENKRIEEINRQLEKLKNLSKDIQNEINTIRNNNIDAYILIQKFIKDLYKIVNIYSESYLDISKIERKVDHLIYLRNILNKNKQRMEKDIKKLNKKKNDLKVFLETKEYKTTYDEWVKDYVKRTLDVGKSSKINSMKFKHSI